MVTLLSIALIIVAGFVIMNRRGVKTHRPIITKLWQSILKEYDNSGKEKV